ncbi:MAG: DMT family transporter [Myxococcales bacterium]|nr:DMT family transporter [Myxococcales bacterium]
MNRQLAGTALVAVAAAGWGTWALFLRGHGLPAVWQSVMILSTIAVAWLPAALAASRKRERRAPVAWALLVSCAVTDAGNYICYFGALDRGPIALAVLTHYIAPVVVALLAPMLLREPLTRTTAIALVVSLCGLGLLVGGAAEGSSTTAALGAASALFYGLNTVFTKKVLGTVEPGDTKAGLRPGDHVPDTFASSELLSYHCFLAAGMVALFAKAAPPASAFLWSPIAGALLLGACGAAIFYVGLRRIPANRAAILTYLEPLVAAMVGFWFFAEPLGASALLGGALIVAAGAAVAFSRGPALEDSR